MKVLRCRDLMISMVLGLAVLVVYVRTLGVSIIYGDSPELTTAAWMLGVAHPTGYPLYTLVGHAFTRWLPWGSVAWRMNLLSAVCAAAAVGVLYAVARRVVGARLPAVAATMLCAFSATFWSQAVIAEVYAAHILFVAVILLCALRWDETGDLRWLRGGVFALGLSFTHHLTTVLLLPALAYWAFTSRRRSQWFRDLRWLVPLFLAPLLLYLYLPWAARQGVPVTWSDTSTWQGFLDHVTGRQYREFMGIRSWSRLWSNVLDYSSASPKRPDYLLTQFTTTLVWLAPIGVWSLWSRCRRTLGLTLLVYLAVVVWSLNYTIQDIDAYYLPSHLIVTLWIGIAIRVMAAWLLRLWKRLRVTIGGRRRLAGLFGVASALLPLMLLTLNWDSNDHSHDRTAISIGRTMLFPLKKNAILIAGGDDWAFPVLYAHYVERVRTDVTVVLFPDLTARDHIALLERRWRERILITRPPCVDVSGGFFDTDYCRVRRFIADNIVDRPMYLMGFPPDAIDRSARFRSVLPRRTAIAARVPLLELHRDQRPIP